MPLRTRLLLVDDHQLVLESLRQSLQAEFDIVGTLSRGSAVAASCLELMPDVVLLDLSLPDRSGLTVIEDVRRAAPGVRIVIVTMHVDRVLADAALQAGAQGFVPKDADLAELRHAIREVMAGHIFLSDLVPNTKPRIALGPAAYELERLTPRQREIVRRLGDGKSTAAIAADLHVSPWTVTCHRTRIRKVLGIDSEWGLMRYALVVRMSEAEEGQKPTLN